MSLLALPGAWSTRWNQPSSQTASVPVARMMLKPGRGWLYSLAAPAAPGSSDFSAVMNCCSSDIFFSCALENKLASVVSASTDCEVDSADSVAVFACTVLVVRDADKVALFGVGLSVPALRGSSCAADAASCGDVLACRDASDITAGASAAVLLSGDGAVVAASFMARPGFVIVASREASAALETALVPGYGRTAGTQRW